MTWTDRCSGNSLFSSCLRSSQWSRSSERWFFFVDQFRPIFDLSDVIGWYFRVLGEKTPLKNDGFRQLGWWQTPNINGKMPKMATKPPTSFFYSGPMILIQQNFMLKHVETIQVIVGSWSLTNPHGQHTTQPLLITAPDWLRWSHQLTYPFGGATWWVWQRFQME